MPRGEVRVSIDPPILGLRTDLPRHIVPDGFLVGGKNVICRDGAVISRPGLTVVTSTAPSSNRVVGAVYYKDHADVERVIAGTTAGLHLYTGGAAWSDVTGTALTGGAGNQIRFTVFMLTGSTRVVAVNDTDVPQSWTGTGNFAALGGSPPVAKCVTSAFQRVILGNITVAGTRRGSSLAISGFQAPTEWASTDQVSLPDTGDSIMEVRALNAQAFVVYKDRSQWVGIGAGDIFPFIFELRDQQPGPVSPASVVQAGTDHFYLGQDGDIYKFDGNRSRPIGSAVRRTIQADIDWALAGRTHGFFDARNREVWWLWTPASGTGTDGIVYRLPYGDIPGAFSPLMTFAYTLSASADWNELGSVTWNSLTGTWDTIATTYPTWDSFGGARRPGGIVGRSNGQVYRFGDAGSDDGNTFDAEWELPLRAVSGVGENVRVDAIESFFKQEASTVNVNVILVTTDTLGTSGTQVASQTIDLSAGTRLRATYADQQARFVGVLYQMNGAIGGREYRGGVLYAWKRGER